MEQQVARRRYGMVTATDLAERMQIPGPGVPNSRSQASEPIPSTQDKPALEVAKAHRPDQCREVGAHGARRGLVVRPGIDRDDEKDREARQSGDDRLRLSREWT